LNNGDDGGELSIWIMDPCKFFIVYIKFEV